MVTKRGNVAKTLAKFLTQFPPENIAPHRTPTPRMRHFIEENFKGKLAVAMENLEMTLMEEYARHNRTKSH